jgi:hypothetical protein
MPMVLGGEVVTALISGATANPPIVTRWSVTLRTQPVTLHCLLL